MLFQPLWKLGNKESNRRAIYFVVIWIDDNKDHHVLVGLIGH